MKNRFATSLFYLGLMLWLAGGSLLAHAVETEAFHDDVYSQLSLGELKSMALTSDGYLLPTYARRTAGNTKAEIVWDALREKNGSILCATGHHGKLIRLLDEHATKTLASLPEPELTAMVRLKDGSTLIAAAPTGRIYRLASDDKLTTFAQIKASFVWRMVADPDGSAWAVTGTEGRLFHLRQGKGGKGQADEVFKFKSANLLDLWIDQEGRVGEPGDIFVAGQNPGWLYRYRPSKKKAEVVYNASAEEIRALLPFEGGLALALNTERAPTSQALNMTLRMAGGSPPPPGMGGPGAPPAAPPGGEQASLAEAFASAPASQNGPPRSEIVILDKAGFARRLWSAPERPIHSLALSPEKKILAAAGSHGRLFEIGGDGEFSVVVDSREEFLVRIVADEQGYLLAAGRNGLVYDMARTRAPEAVYLSRPLDAGTLVKWGHANWHGDQAGGQKALLAFRTGNDGDPESNLWGEWSKDLEAPPDTPQPLPANPARFIQYRLTLRQHSADAKPERLDYLDLFYIEQNIAPHVLQVTATEAPPPNRPAGKDGPPPSAGAGEGRSGEAPQSTAGAREPRSNPMLFNIAWKIVDANNDVLRYAVYYRATDEQEWKLIDDKLSAAQLPLSVSGVADGRYRFRVVATDELSNPPAAGLKTEGISNEVIVDNTPPEFTSKSVNVHGHLATLRVEVADKLSLISALKVDIDNGDAYPLLPLDGLMDQKREQFVWETGELKPGEHVITINATDQRGNTAVEKVVFTVEK